MQEPINQADSPDGLSASGPSPAPIVCIRLLGSGLMRLGRSPSFGQRERLLLVTLSLLTGTHGAEDSQVFFKKQHTAHYHATQCVSATSLHSRV